MGLGSRPVTDGRTSAARVAARGTTAGGPTSRSPSPPSPLLRGAPKERQQDQRKRGINRTVNARPGPRDEMEGHFER